MEAALILERDSPAPVREIGRLVAMQLGLHPADAIARVRYGGGIIVESAPAAAAAKLQAALREIGVFARAVPAGTLGIVPRGIKALRLEFAGDGAVAGLAGGRSIVLRRDDMKAVHLYGLLSPDDRRSPVAAPPSGGGRRKQRGGSSTAGLERFTEAAANSSRGEGLSPRGRRLVENLRKAELAALRFHLTIFCLDPVGPVRIAKDLFDYSSQGRQKQSHSLDNFLILVDTVLSHLPDAWNREAASRFLQSLDPTTVLRKEEEVTNFERWVFQWIHLEHPGGAASFL